MHCFPLQETSQTHWVWNLIGLIFAQRRFAAGHGLFWLPLLNAFGKNCNIGWSSSNQWLNHSIANKCTGMTCLLTLCVCLCSGFTLLWTICWTYMVFTKWKRLEVSVWKQPLRSCCIKQQCVLFLKLSKPCSWHVFSSVACRVLCCLTCTSAPKPYILTSYPTSGCNCWLCVFLEFLRVSSCKQADHNVSLVVCTLWLSIWWQSTHWQFSQLS